MLVYSQTLIPTLATKKMWSSKRLDRAEASYNQQQQQQEFLNRSSSAPNRRQLQNQSQSQSQLPPLVHNDVTKPTSAENSTQSISLKLKNEAQRKERAAREQEESILQERVNDHLASLLAAHKQQKKAVMSKWNAHALSPIPHPPPPPAVVRKRTEEAQREEQERQDRRMRAREATKRRLQRGTMLEPNADPNQKMLESMRASASLLHQASTSSSSFGGINNINNSMGISSQQKELSDADARASANFQQIAQIYETVLQPQKTEKELDETTTEIPLTFVPHTIRDLHERDDFGPLLVALSPEQRKRLRDIDRKHERTRAKLEAQKVMFETAKQRRQVASDRIRDDPPADVLVQADLRRYIPADLLEAIPELNGGGGFVDNNNNNNINNNTKSFFLTDVNEASLTKKERKEKVDKNSEELKNGKEGKKEKRKQSLSALANTNFMNQSTKLAAINSSAKSQALAGGPLLNPANNKRMTIFAREVLMKLATTQAMRDEKEKSRVQREKDETRRKFLEAGLKPLTTDDDDDDKDDQDQDGDGEGKNNAVNANHEHHHDHENDHRNDELTTMSARKRRQRDLEAHSHDYDHFFTKDSGENNKNNNSNLSSGQDYLTTKFNIAQEQQAAVEWYRKYHQPLMAGGRKDKSLLGARRGMSSSHNNSQREHQHDSHRVSDDHWKASHKPIVGLPRPSRTLFFDSEKSSSELRKSLF